MPRSSHRYFELADDFDAYAHSDEQDFDPYNQLLLEKPSPVKFITSKTDRDEYIVPLVKSQDIDGGGLNAIPVTATLRFKIIILALNISLFLAVLEAGAIGVALPTIVDDLQGKDFIWIGSAYTIASVALVPVYGGISEAIGRQPVILASVLIFTAGGAVCGAARTMNMLILGRTIQGAGGGGIFLLPQIILTDLVPLSERATYLAIFSFTWCLSGGTGPIIAGALATAGLWRCIFYINLPVAAAACILLTFCMPLKIPSGSIRENLRRVDWLGNIIIVSATCSFSLALVWGGAVYAWSSPRVIVPLACGILGVVAFFVYEAKFANSPMVPWEVISDRTSLSGFIQTFFVGFSVFLFAYYLPTYYQAVIGASPIAAGVDLLPVALLAPVMSMLTGLTIKSTKSYRPQLFLGFIFQVLGIGVVSLFNTTTSRAMYLGGTLVFGLGWGMVFIATYFPVLAPLRLEQHPAAISFLIYIRLFGQVWGVCIAGNVLQNQLHKNLPASFFEMFPSGTDIAYALIPVIPTLPEPLRTSVQTAFAESMRTMWIVAASFTSLAVISCLFMKALPLHTQTDRKWGLRGSNE